MVDRYGRTGRLGSNQRGMLKLHVGCAYYYYSHPEKMGKCMYFGKSSTAQLLACLSHVSWAPRKSTPAPKLLAFKITTLQTFPAFARGESLWTIGGAARRYVEQFCKKISAISCILVFFSLERACR